MSTTAAIFPGQGVPTAGLRAIVEAGDPALLRQAESSLGGDIFARADESTRYAQPAIFCADLALWGRKRKDLDGATPLAFSGHSLGELPALVAAGCLEPKAGLWLAAERGRITAEVARETDGAMLALLGFNVEGATQLAAEHGVYVSNDNCPGQVVLSGPRKDLEAAQRHAHRKGRRAKMLNVEGAFHSPLMEPAVAPFRARLAKVGFAPPSGSVFSGISAGRFNDIPAQLAAALTEPVRWSDTVRALRASGVESFLECGPGRVLTTLIKRIVNDQEQETRL